MSNEPAERDELANLLFITDNPRAPDPVSDWYLARRSSPQPSSTPRG